MLGSNQPFFFKVKPVLALCNMLWVHDLCCNCIHTASGLLPDLLELLLMREPPVALYAKAIQYSTLQSNITTGQKEDPLHFELAVVTQALQK